MNFFLAREAHRIAHMLRALQCHPDIPCPMVEAIEVRFDRDAADVLKLTYRLDGDLRRLRIPETITPSRKDELWRHTCFEAFVRTPGATGYYELNFAPSGDWAAYAFGDYRTGMHPLEFVQPPQVTQKRTPSRLEVEVCLRMPIAIDGARWSVTAIVEDTVGNAYYWALAHPPGKPDFHHPSSFTLTLPSWTAP